VADIVENHGVVGVERGELALETQVAPGSEQPLDKGEGRREEDAVAAAEQLVADGGDEVAAWERRTACRGAGATSAMGR